MTEQHHRVFRLTIDLSLPQEEQPAPIQDRISSLLKSSLYQKIDRVFSQFNDPSWHIKLDQLDLDLGKIDLHRLETDFPQQMEKALKTALQQLYLQKTIQEKPSFQEYPALSTALEVLSFFLEKGSFPWWLPEHLPRDPKPIFHQIFQEDSIQLKTIITKLIGSEWPRKRIVNTFEDKEIKQIIQLLDPINAAVMIAYNEKLVKQHEKEALIKIDRQEFKKVGWEIILKYLYDKRGSEFNQRNFLKRLLLDLAARFNITYRALLEKLEAIAKRFLASDQAAVSLLKNIIYLAKEEKLTPIGLPISKKSSNKTLIKTKVTEKPIQELAPLERLLEITSAKQPATKAVHLDQQLHLFQRLWATNRNQAIGLVKQLMLNRSPPPLIIAHLPDSLFKKVLLQIQPSFDTEVYLLKEDLIKIVAGLSEWSTLTAKNIIHQALLSLAVRTVGDGQSVRLILETLLKRLATTKNYTYPQLLQRFSSALKQNPSLVFNSKLLVYLQQLMATQLTSLDALFFEAPKHGITEKGQFYPNAWQFHPGLETPKAYLERIQFWVRQKKHLPSIHIIFNGTANQKFWLPLLVKQGPATQRKELLNLLWPNLGAFYSYWVTDILLILQHYGLQKNIAKLPKWSVELILWELLLDAGTGGMTKVNLVQKSLDRLAIQLREDRTLFFHSIHQLSIAYAETLNLKTTLQSLVQKAIQQHLFVANLPQTSLRPKDRKDTSIISLDALTQYIGKGILPIGITTETLRQILQQHLQHQPDALKIWLESMLQKPDSRERLIMFFSSATQVQLMDLLATPAGQIAFEIRRLIKALGASQTQAISGVQQKRYWRLVWEVLTNHQRKGFSIRPFLLAIIQKMAVVLKWTPQKLLEKLNLKVMASATTLSFIPTILQVAYFFNLPIKSNYKGQFPTLLSDTFDKMTPLQLVAWLEQYLFANPLPNLTPSKKEAKLLYFGHFVQQLPVPTQRQIWQVLSDQTVHQFFQHLLSNEELNLVLDLAEVVNIVKQQKQIPQTKLFSSDLTSLLLSVILTQRGSIANQKAFATRLFKDWARAHSMTYRVYIELLWPIVKTLTPIFHHHASLIVFSDLIQEELGTAFVELVSPPPKKPTKTIKQKADNNYKKLWDMDKKPLVIEEDWVVENAGLILLWPYFKILFERVDMLTDGKFIDEETQQKGILLLEYLATGNTSPSEHELVLNKVLCGYPVAAPITVKLSLDDDLQALCNGLLAASIQHWEALGKTSIPTFRETFLIRTGNLGRTEKNWQLQINSKAYDVLLRQLPWGISTINLSWMEQIMKVEWE